MMDFRIDKYCQLVRAFQNYGFDSLVLRHNLDLLPGYSFRTARLEADLGVLAFSFLAIPKSVRIMLNNADYQRRFK